jgi:hypothetical protein
MRTTPSRVCRKATGALAAALVLAAAGCGGDGTEPRPSRANDHGGLPEGNEPVHLDPAQFTTKIDNRWWPMPPGKRWRYRETDQEGTKQDVVVTVTDRTKKIANGVTGRVVRDTVSAHGHIIEDTFDWYAQDKHGTIWYLGEDTAEFEHGKLTTKAGSFEAGVDGAMAGVIMPARPRDDQAYREEYYEGQAEDRGEVLGTHEMAQTPYGFFKHALLIKDTTPLEPRVLEYKLYAPRIGPALTVGVSGGPGSREELLELDTAPASWVRKAGAAPLGDGPV